MRRFFALAIVAMLVLGLSAGTAFASTCAIAPCQAMIALSAPVTAPACSMGALASGCAAGPGARMGSKCDMRVAQRTTDGVSTHAAPEVSPAVSTGVLLPALVSGSSAVAGFVPADARGAPHLSSVIRV